MSVRSQLPESIAGALARSQTTRAGIVVSALAVAAALFAVWCGDGARSSDVPFHIEPPGTLCEPDGTFCEAPALRPPDEGIVAPAAKLAGRSVPNS